MGALVENACSDGGGSMRGRTWPDSVFTVRAREEGEDGPNRVPFDASREGRGSLVNVSAGSTCCRE